MKKFLSILASLLAIGLCLALLGQTKVGGAIATIAIVLGICTAWWKSTNPNNER